MILEGWETANIMPIHKGEDEDDAKNYRGISVLDASYKIMTHIMNERLKEWVSKEEILGESQASFRGGRGTRDQIFTLKTMIGRRLREKGGKLFVAFIDFRAAFDRVDRNLLIDKLEKKGIQGKMLGMIEKMYSNTKNEIITGKGKTEGFGIGKGVRQGCPMSPMLFNIFTEDMEKNWIKHNEGGTVVGGTKIYALKFADDVAMGAEDAEGLRKMIKDL